ncbi:hypothetical protein BT96DRAFT_923465 [Gymnopus androsaceus JB14]|uniref:ABM domain-containing protein n=1 Tax=Gymnopus androsaceus JB14 TaxID=1447944 RepID=A0A6A4HAE7_9AGAR|nr:hypothetical protein BT96DRAFT_923465 [Gymnopus androsaceus JB14]
MQARSRVLNEERVCLAAGMSTMRVSVARALSYKRIQEQLQENQNTHRSPHNPQSLKMSFITPPPKTTPSGKILSIVTGRVKAGKEEILAEVLKNVQKRAESDEEPGTLTFRVTRRLDSEGNFLPVFFLIEEYASDAAFKEHLAGPGFESFAKALKEHDFFEEGSFSIDYMDDI